MIITNPTHFAVALRYGRDVTAPKVVAKGRDLIALRIREIAREHGIAIVENPPLARALYKAVEVGQEIPAELFSGVAEVLAYVYRTSRRKLSGRDLSGRDVDRDPHTGIDRQGHAHADLGVAIGVVAVVVMMVVPLPARAAGPAASRSTSRSR